MNELGQRGQTTSWIAFARRLMDAGRWAGAIVAGGGSARGVACLMAIITPTALLAVLQSGVG